MRKETGEEFLWTISSHPFHPLFDPSTIPHPAQGNGNMKRRKIVLGLVGGGEIVWTLNKSDQSFWICLSNVSPPHWALLQWQRCLRRCATACPSTSPARESATLSRWTLRPCKAESSTQLSLKATCCPSYWQRKEWEAALLGCLGAAKSCKVIWCISGWDRHQAFHFRYQLSTPPPESSPEATCPTRPSPPPSSAGRWSQPQRWCPGQRCIEIEVRSDDGHLTVPVVVLPQVSVPSLAGHVEGSEAHVPVWEEIDKSVSVTRFELCRHPKHSNSAI